MYDRDAEGTIGLVDVLASGLPPTAAASLPTQDEALAEARSMFPELRRRSRAAMPRSRTGVAPAGQSVLVGTASDGAASYARPVLGGEDLSENPEPAISSEQIEQMFPEVRARKSQEGGRVTWADRPGRR